MRTMTNGPGMSSISYPKQKLLYKAKIRQDTESIPLTSFAVSAIIFASNEAWQ